MSRRSGTAPGTQGPRRVLVVGGGHNGLVAACYLARAGVDVQVLEQSDRPGGGARTEETIPGHRFDTHSAAHNIINMTDIVEDLRLEDVGLTYQAMDPFAIAVLRDGRTVRFHRSVEQTVASIREVSAPDADAYARWMHDVEPLVRMAVTGLQAGADWRRQLALTPDRLRGVVLTPIRMGGIRRTIATLATPYGPLLRRLFDSEAVRAPIAAFAAHGNASPTQVGSAFNAIWQASYHIYGQWHAVGGARGLTDALVRRLESHGGSVRCDADVVRIDAAGGRVRGVELADGERLQADTVLTALDPQTALLDLLDPPLAGRDGRELRAAHRGNTVQMLVHLALDRLPAYADTREGDHTGLQSYVDDLQAVEDGFARAEARLLPHDPVPTYAFTPTATDPSLAPEGQHTMYLACPTAPHDLEGGWDAQAEAFAERMIDTVEARVPGFRSTITGRHLRTPPMMSSELRWPRAHPMVLDITPDQMLFARPTLGLGDHRTDVEGLYLTGAGTAPIGGIAGTPGRAAAKAILKAR